MARGMSAGVRTALGVKHGTPWWLKKPKHKRVPRGAHARHLSHAAKHTGGVYAMAAVGMSLMRRQAAQLRQYEMKHGGPGARIK